MIPWYALHVESCCESLVSRKLEDVGVEPYYPFATSKSKRLYRPDVKQALMPGYVFARMELADRIPVLSINQVIRILGIGLQSVAIPEQEIENLKILTSARVELTDLARFPEIPIGKPVRITGGPLQGIQGIVVYARPGKKRVIVSISMLNQSVSAEVDADCLEIDKVA